MSRTPPPFERWRLTVAGDPRADGGLPRDVWFSDALCDSTPAGNEGVNRNSRLWPIPAQSGRGTAQMRYLVRKWSWHSDA